MIGQKEKPIYSFADALNQIHKQVAVSDALEFIRQQNTPHHSSALSEEDLYILEIASICFIEGDTNVQTSARNLILAIIHSFSVFPIDVLFGVPKRFLLMATACDVSSATKCSLLENPTLLCLLNEGFEEDWYSYFLEVIVRPDFEHPNVEGVSSIIFNKVCFLIENGIVDDPYRIAHTLYYIAYDNQVQISADDILHIAEGLRNMADFKTLGVLISLSGILMEYLDEENYLEHLDFLLSHLTHECELVRVDALVALSNVFNSLAIDLEIAKVLDCIKPMLSEDSFKVKRAVVELLPQIACFYPSEMHQFLLDPSVIDVLEELVEVEDTRINNALIITSIHLKSITDEINPLFNLTEMDCTHPFL